MGYMFWDHERMEVYVGTYIGVYVYVIRICIGRGW